MLRAALSNMPSTYDYLPATQWPALTADQTGGRLFTAGQTQCTTGYEEAVAQGIGSGLTIV